MNTRLFSARMQRKGALHYEKAAGAVTKISHFTICIQYLKVLKTIYCRKLLFCDSPITAYVHLRLLSAGLSQNEKIHQHMACCSQVGSYILYEKLIL